jgi:hypothetical protein
MNLSKGLYIDCGIQSIIKSLSSRDVKFIEDKFLPSNALTNISYSDVPLNLPDFAVVQDISPRREGQYINQAPRYMSTQRERSEPMPKSFPHLNVIHYESDYESDDSEFYSNRPVTPSDEYQVELELKLAQQAQQLHIHQCVKYVNHKY